ncbi:hypothetical protein SDC9_121997 [bioreactor metagenome]|uniref:Uncharacterized protein n=1 Tax=bioreactor metagenome TaxID=1076179 RepID=A0A645CDF3_9ZZZZ
MRLIDIHFMLRDISRNKMEVMSFSIELCQEREGIIQLED